VRAAAEERVEELAVVPLFIGPSRSLTHSIPEQFARESGGKGVLRVAPPLYGPDGTLGRILTENLLASGWERGRGTVLLCAHGSPAGEMAEVRNFLAAEIRSGLRLSPEELIACSMDRRPGSEYDFNEPRLESAIKKAAGEAVILMQFLLPGRHAGADGGVAGICRKNAPAGLKWKLSPLIGAHPALPSLLAARFKEIVP